MSGIIELISEYADKTEVRFHMPGHKGMATGCFLDPVYPYDVTELPVTDDLYALPRGGAFDKLCGRLSETFYSDFTLISAAGATLGIQTALLCAVRCGAGRFLFDRKSHISAIRAAALCGIDPDYSEFDDASSASYDAVFVTSPDYYGRMRDIVAIKKNYPGALIIVDNSHGSHLAFYGGGELHPNRLGADIVIDSVHKTLPALTGAALIHFNNGKITRGDALFSLRTFASTSPSFLIAASVEAMLDYMNANPNGMALLAERINNFGGSISSSPFYFSSSAPRDPFRICLSSGDENSVLFDADLLCDYLSSKHIVCEFSDRESVVLIPSVMNGDEDFAIAAAAINEYAASHKPEKTPRESGTYPKIVKAKELRQALLSAGEELTINDCSGRVAACPVYAYPPGIAAVPPGAVLTQECINYAVRHNIMKATVCK